MKKLFLILIITFVLVWNADAVFAKGQDKGGPDKGVSHSNKGRKQNEGDNQKNQEQKKEKEKPGAAEDANNPKGKSGNKADKAKEENSRKGTEHQQQLQALEQQMEHEEAKHLERVARLERMKEMFSKEGKTNNVEKVIALMEKEQSRYEHKKQNTEEKRQRILQALKESGAGGEKEKPDVNEPAKKKDMSRRRAEYRAKAQKEIIKENIGKELEKIEKAVEQETKEEK